MVKEESFLNIIWNKMDWKIFSIVYLDWHGREHYTQIEDEMFFRNHHSTEVSSGNAIVISDFTELAEIIRWKIYG